MSAPLLVLTALAGGAGALARFGVDALVRGAGPARGFPWGILVVNVSGSFALGALTGAAAAMDAAVVTVLGAGLLGGYTTFSTVCVDAALLWREGNRRAAALDALGTLAIATLAAALGVAAGAVVAGA